MADVELEPGLVVDESVRDAFGVMAGMPEFFAHFLAELVSSLGTWNAVAVFLHTPSEQLGGKRPAEVFIDRYETKRIDLVRQALEAYQGKE